MTKSIVEEAVAVRLDRVRRQAVVRGLRAPLASSGFSFRIVAAAPVEAARAQVAKLKTRFEQ